MKFENVLLGLLAMKPFHGYELMKWLDAEGQFLRSNTHHSQIYRQLGRMVSDGLVTFDVDAREGRPDAKIYRITDLGRDALLEWVRSPYKPTSRFQDVDFNARFVSAVALDLAAAIAQIDAELAYRREQVAVGRVRKRGLSGMDPISEFNVADHSWIGEQMHVYGADAVDNWMAWLETMRAELVVRQKAATDDNEETTA